MTDRFENLQPPPGCERTTCVWCGAGEVEFASPVWRKVALAHALTCGEHPLRAEVERLRSACGILRQEVVIALRDAPDESDRHRIAIALDATDSALRAKP